MSRSRRPTIPRSWSAPVALLLWSGMTSPGGAAAHDVDAALASMAKEIAEVRQSCDRPVTIQATKVALSDKVDGVHVVLTSPTCLGQFGQYDALLAQDTDGRWRTVLGEGPGMLAFSRDGGSHVARIGVSALMGCELSFTWNGSIYVRHASKACAGGSKSPGWRILERIMRTADAPPPPPAGGLADRRAGRYRRKGRP